MMSSTSTRATSKCRPAVPSARRRAIAHAYSVFATGGRELGLRPETLELLAAPAVPPARGFYDECMKGDGIQFSLGFMKSTPALPFGSASCVRIARSRRRSRLCGSGGGRRLRVRDEQDGNAADRRPAGCGAQRRALLLHFDAVRRVARGTGRSELTAPASYECRKSA